MNTVIIFIFFMDETNEIKTKRFWIARNNPSYDGI